jgi:hypothetical protein
MWSTIWEMMNSPAGITAMAALVLFVLNYIYSRKPLWKQFEGAIITGIKLAEKAIPDDVENKALKRLNDALFYVCRLYEEMYGVEPTTKQVAKLKDGIGMVHSELEAKGQLHGTTGKADS